MPEAEARELLGETAHVLAAIGERLKKRKVRYSSVFSLRPGAGRTRKPQTEVVAALMGEPDEDPNDLAALDAAWEEEEVTFGPAAAPPSAARTARRQAARVRRPAPGMPVPRAQAPVITYTPSNRA